MTTARKQLAAFGEGDHEVAVGDAGCWLLTEHRTANGPRVWELFEVTPRGRRLRLHVEPGYRDADPELAARHLERPGDWVVGSAWTEYAETIRTCRDEPDGGDVRCAGSAIH